MLNQALTSRLTGPAGELICSGHSPCDDSRSFDHSVEQRGDFTMPLLQHWVSNISGLAADGESARKNARKGWQSMAQHGEQGGWGRPQEGL